MKFKSLCRRGKKIQAFCLGLVFFISFNISAQWFDPQSLSSTVLIEKKIAPDSMVVHGTGFALWNYSYPEMPIIITAGHLLQNRTDLYISLNADSSIISFMKKNNIDTLLFGKMKWTLEQNKLRTNLNLFTGLRPSYFVDSTLDVGMFLIQLGMSAYNDSADSMKIADLLLIPRSMMRSRKDISLGDELYFVGFPFGLGAYSINQPIIRSGSVAWVSESSSEFLLDAFSFGGNSGSPIFSKRIFGRKFGEINWDEAYLVGMVVGHHGQRVEGILRQPNPKENLLDRISFETQNWGLAIGIWIEDILKELKKIKNLSLPVFE